LKILIAVLWVLVLLSAGLGGLQLILAMNAEAAPAQGAAAAVAVGFAVIPYVAVRAIEGIAGRGTNQDPPKY
jgi:heme A synthase